VQQLAVVFLGRHGKTEVLRTHRRNHVDECSLCLKYHGFVDLVIRQRRSVSAEFARLHFDGFYCASLLSPPRHAASDRKALSLREKLCIPRVYAGVRYPRTVSGISLASRPLSSFLCRKYSTIRAACLRSFSAKHSKSRVPLKKKNIKYKYY